MKLLEHIDYGFIAYTGQAWPDCNVDSYNRQIDMCNTFIMAGRPVPENILNGKHNLFYEFSRRLNQN